jgi:hypothetical protein
MLLKQLKYMIAAQAELFLVESCNTDEAPQTFFPASDVLKTYSLLVETIIVKDNSKGFNNFQSFMVTHNLFTFPRRYCNLISCKQ